MHNASDKDIWQSQERNPAGFQDEDVVGAGRYVLSFLPLGIIGLGIQYGLRKKGWTATWINAVIFLILVMVFAATG